MNGFTIDHVFSLVSDLGASREAVASLGFHVTEKGEHTGRGTANHLIVFPDVYWELLGVVTPTPTNAVWRQRLQRGPGLFGCALATNALESDLRLVRARGLEISSPSEFSRPVAVNGEAQIAAFRTARFVQIEPLDIAFFFCQHLTPEQIWRQEWQSHPNGAIGIDSLTILAEDVRSASELLGRVFNTDPVADSESSTFMAGTIEVRCVSRRRFAQLFPGAPTPEETVELAALTFSVSSPSALARNLRNNGLTITNCPEGVYTQHPEFDRNVIAFAKPAT